MTISEKSIKLLWANAAGRCSYPECNERLTVEQAANSAPYTLGQMAHIKGRKKGTNRYDPRQTDEERDSYENLILLCPNHHTLVDRPENEEKFSVGYLLEMKKKHEEKIIDLLRSNNISTYEDLCKEILIFLAENRQVWITYGPVSENAKKNPNSDELYAIWLSERLSTIVPNNRGISILLQKYRRMFDKSKQDIVSMFLTHARSYEKWVNDEISYQAVEPFPLEFEELIRS